MREPDAVMTRIGRGIELSQRGERDAARDLLAEIWVDIGAERADPLHRCAVAHHMADTQDDVSAELAWDLRALAAADLITDERAAEAGVAVPPAAFYPSLHLNIAECHRRLGQHDRAREHLHRGAQALEALQDDGYRQMIKRAFDWLAERL